MHKVFAASSLALLAVTVWMMAADHDDEWRVYQSQFQQHQAEKLRAKETAIKNAPGYSAEVASLSEKIKAAKAGLVKLQAARNKVDTAYRQVLGDFARADLETGHECCLRREKAEQILPRSDAWTRHPRSHSRRRGKRFRLRGRTCSRV